MSTFQPTKKKQTSSSDVFTPTSRKSYDSTVVYGWEQANRESLNLLNDYNNRINKSEWLDEEDRKKYRSALDSYIETSNLLRGITKSFGGGYTDEDEQKWTDSIASMNKGYEDISGFYGQFKNDTEYKTYTKQQEYNSLRSAEDFENNKGYSSTEINVGDLASWWKNATSQYSLGYSDLAYEYINNQNGLRDEIKSKYRTYSRDNMFAEGESDYEQKGYDFLEEDEIGIYNYLYSTQGKDAAQEYLDLMETELVKRKAGEEFKNLEGNTLSEIFYGAVVGAEQWRQGVENLGSMITGEEGFSPSSQYVSGMVREDLADDGFKVLGNSVGQMGYDLVNTTSNMLPSILVGAATGSLGGALTLGLSATGNAYTEMRHLGYDRWQATAYAGLVGASETALSYFLGGISKLGGGSNGIFQTVASKILPKIDNAFARVAIELGGNMLDEGLEEAIQEVLDPVFKMVATGEDFEGIDLENVLYSGLLGALSAGVLEGAPTISGNISSSYNTYVQNGGLSAGGAIKAAFDPKTSVAEAYKKGRTNVTEMAGEFTNAALEIDPDNAHAQRMQARLNDGKNVSGYQINRLVEANENALIAEDKGKIKATAEAKLNKLGETGDVSKIAEAIAKHWSGEKLTKAEQGLIANSTYGRRVSNGFNPEYIMSGEYDTAYAESMDTERINVEAYSKRVPTTSEASVEQANTTPVAENTHAKENATEAKNTASVTVKNAEGKTVNSDIASVEVDGDKASFTLANGEKVESGKVAFKSENAKLVADIAVEKVSRVEGFSNEAATAMIKGYDGSISPTQYTMAFDDAFKMGAKGIPSSKLVGVINSGVSEKVAYTAYELGRQSTKNVETGLNSLSNNGIINTNKSEANNENGENVHLRNGGKRDGGKNTKRKVSRMESSTGQAESRGKTSRIADSEAARLVNEGREVKVSDLGILGGSTEQTVRVVDKANETSSMKEARKRAEARGLKVTFFTGDNLVIKDKSGEWISARAFIKGNNVFVRADHSLYTADQLMRHELGHDMIAKGEVDIKAVRERLEKTVGKENIDAAAEHYANAYAGSGMSADEIWEECICDSLGDMNIFAGNEDIGTFLDQMLPEISAAANESKAPTQTRGSPDAKTSRELNENAIFEEETEIYVTRKETREVFTRMVYDENCEVGERGQIAYAYKVSRSPSEAGQKIQEELGKLGIKGIIYNFLASNYDGITTTYKAGAATLGGVGVFISNDIGRNPIEAAGHEAFHYWIISPEAGDYIETVRSNIEFSSKAFINFQSKIAKDYFGEELPLVDKRWGLLSEEIYAYITGYIYSGDVDNDVRPFLRDYDAVKAAMDSFFESQQSKGKFSREVDSLGNELSPAVQKRFANSKVVDENGRLKVVYHGTVSGEFNIFDKTKGSVEGDFGSGFYFTDKETDVEKNYEFGGPDFENKVWRRAEQMWDEDSDIDMDEARTKARDELYKESHRFEVYLNIENPAVVGKTILFDNTSYLEEYDEADYDNYDDYIGDVEQLLADDVDNIIWDIERNIDLYSGTDSIRNVLYDAYYEGGVDIEKLKAKINELYLESTDGEIVGNEVTRQIIESLGYDGIIDSTVSSKFKNMGMEEGTTHYIAFKPNQIKSITNQNPTDNPDIRYSRELDTEYLSAVNRGDTEAAQKMVDEAAKKAGYTVKAYHGTSRGDRVGNVFLPERATSGPMAFFTDNREIAEGYSKGKQDTSMAYDPDFDRYETQFRIKTKYNDIPLYKAWGYLPFDARNRITKKAGQLREDWDGDGDLILDPTTNEAGGGFQWQLKESRGNAIQALTEQWLNSGNLFNEEARFLDVLEMAGVTEEFKKIGMDSLYFKDPHARHEKVYDTFLKINNPLDTSIVDEKFVADLEAWYEEQDQSKYERESVDTDLWDKNSIDAYVFAERLRDDIEKGTFHAWTSIPDSVTDYLKYLGYDGIKDLGGKHSDVGHTVWIPFSSEQVKSAEPVTYNDKGEVIPLSERFNPKNVDIRYSRELDFIEFINEQAGEESDPNLTKTQKVAKVRGELEKMNVGKGEIMAVMKLADKMFDVYGGDSSISDFRYGLFEASKLALNGSETGFEAAYDIIHTLAREVAYNPKDVGGDAELLKEIKAEIRGTKMAVHEKDKTSGEFDRYGGYGAFRKSHLGKFMLANDGVQVDAKYEELQNLYGKSFFPDVNTVSEQLLQMAKLMDTPLSDYMMVSDEELEATADGMVQSLFAKLGNIWGRAVKSGETIVAPVESDKFSNRSLLAGALETAVQNDIEREKLRQYKQKIDLINSEEKKLHDLREQIKELSFKKGPRDTEAIRRLQFEANQAANRINTYDKQLLNLESTKALKGVLEREKALARKRDAQKYKEAVDRYREKSAKAQRELMDRYQESRKKATEGRNKTAMRYKIKGIVSELNTLLLKPTAKKHIKEELRKEVADALSAINMDTVGADERVAKYNYLIAKENNPDVIAELTKTRDRIQLQGESLKEKLNNLQSAYEKIKNTDDIELNLAYQEVIHNSIKAVSEKIGNTSIRNMTLEQLEMVYDLVSMIRKTVRDANKSFKEKKGLTIMQMAEAVNDQVRTVGGQPYKRNAINASLQRAGWTLLKPYVAFRTIGSVTLTNMYKELRNGEDTFYTDVKEAQAFIEAQYKKHGYKSWDMKKTKTFTAKSGKTFELSLEQMMSLYAYYKREQAHDHIIEGGIVFEDSLITEKNKWGVPIKYEVTTKDAFNLSEETFKGICDYLEKEHKDAAAFVNEMQAYLSDTMGAKGNEVSMELLGVKLFKEKFYLPIKSSQYYMNFKAEEAGEVKLKSPAFSKETVQHANNPIVIHNFTDLWAEHINDMAMYHSFVLALEDFTRVYNYKTKTDAKVETMDTKATLETAYPGVTKYINKFLKDMNGGVRGETVGWAEKLTSLSKKGAVLGSASVTIQQPSAVMRAMAYINPKYFVTSAHQSINLVKHKADWAELKRYAPIAGIKEMGRFDVGMGQGTVDWIQSNKTVLEKAEDILSLPPALMDEITWVSIWNAVKRETLHNNKSLSPTSEEFLKLAGERFTEVISLSQVYDSVFSRSDIMRNTSWIAKSLTAFMAESTTTLNMIWDSWVQGKRTGSAKGFVKASATVGSSIVAATVFNAVLKSIITAMRDDDEDESYAEKYLEHLVGEFKDNLNPLRLVPFAKDVVSIFQGYGAERMDMALFSDLAKAIDAFDSDSKTLYEKWSGLIGAISAFFGVPVKNVERDIRGFITTHFGKTEETTIEGMLNAIKEGWTGKKVSNGQQLYEAMLKGDSAQIKRIEGRFKDQSDIDSAIRKALRENDPRMKEAAEAYIAGDYARSNALRAEIVAEGVFDRKLVTDAFKAEVNYLKDKAKEGK